METAVIILAWKSILEANDLAKKILKWDNVDTKIIIVCNQYEDLDDAVLDKEIIYLFNKDNKGYGGGNNEGMRKAIELGSKYVLLLNPDALIDQINFVQLLKSLQLQKNSFAMSPLLNEGNGNNYTTYLGGRDITTNVNTRIVYKPNDQKKLINPIEVDYCIGAIVLYNLNLIKKLNFFDEDYFFSGEVADLCFRAKSIGFKSYTDPSSIGIHNIDQNSNVRKSMYLYYSMRNRFLYIKKNKYSFSTKVYWYTFLFRQLFSGILRLDFSLIRTISRVIHHVSIGTYKNQNHHFIHQNH